MGNITDNFSFYEFERSDKAQQLGIDNKIPNDIIRANIQTLAKEVLQPLRDKILVLVRPTELKIRITSGYRSPELNTAVGGSPTSFHCYGFAADCELLLKVGGQWEERNALLFHAAHAYNHYTELIWEYGVLNPVPYMSAPAWVHIAYNEQDQRKMLKYIS